MLVLLNWNNGEPGRPRFLEMFLWPQTHTLAKVSGFSFNDKKEREKILNE